MNQTQDTYSLADFNQNAQEHLQRLHATGRAEVLTVNGKVEAVVLTPKAYHWLMQMSMAEVRAEIGVGLEQARLGQLIDGGAAEADRLERELHELMGRLAHMPGMGHLRSDLCDEPLRFFPLYRFLVIYRPETNPIQVIRVLHSARDVRAILGPESID